MEMRTIVFGRGLRKIAFVLLFCFICVPPCYARLGRGAGLGVPPLFVQEEDGSPRGRALKMIFPNGMLAFSGTHVHVHVTASIVLTDTSNFDTNLSSADDTIQKALDTLDEAAGGTGDSVTVNGAAIDTTANFIDRANNINFTKVDGGAGGPDDIYATLATNPIIDGKLTVKGVISGSHVETTAANGQVRTAHVIATVGAEIIGDVLAKRIINTPIGSQSITAASDTIQSGNGIVDISSDADYLMASTPTITTGTAGQWLLLRNTGSFEITIQDDSDLVGSDIFHGGTSGIINPNDLLTLVYTDSNGGGWEVQSHPNIQLASGATGLTIRAGENLASALLPVYISGYNVGLDLLEVSIADQDDSSKMPAIGVTLGAISNNATGLIVESGPIVDVNTSAFAVEETLWVSSTGTLTNVKPSVDDIQAMAIVARSNASNGSVMVVGAGRVNDVPRRFTNNFIASSHVEVTTTIRSAHVVVTAGMETAPDTNIFGKREHLRFNLFNPNSLYDTDPHVCIVPKLDAGIQITRVRVSTSDVTNDISGEIRYANAFTSLIEDDPLVITGADATTITEFDTTSGVRDSSHAVAVPASKSVYIFFDADPSSTITQVCIDIEYHY